MEGGQAEGMNDGTMHSISSSPFRERREREREGREKERREGEGNPWTDPSTDDGSKN